MFISLLPVLLACDGVGDIALAFPVALLLLLLACIGVNSLLLFAEPVGDILRASMAAARLDFCCGFSTQ